MTFWNLSSFLTMCQKSRQMAYDQLKGLLQNLESQETQQESYLFLQELLHYFNSSVSSGDTSFQQKYHFTFYSLTIDKEDLNFGTLNLLQLPSTFTPEEWSFTFYEGLTRYPLGEFQGKLLCELGCGNGWISLLMAGKYLPVKIYGFDINPRAITCAKLNLYLNAFDGKGNLKNDLEGKSLFDRVEFHTSDLLQYCRENRLHLDRILGCIPQVLGPDPQMTTNMVSENASDDFLYSLSNYCGKQGLIEDQFGLGLVARALEEGVVVLRPAGKIILNLGGRPGSAILDRLFLRRGFSIRKVWQKKVEQAGDTDISSLVEIEKNTPHRFEFYMNPISNESISAKTAHAYLKGGGSIYHSLTVYDAVLRHPGHIQRIMRRLNEVTYQNVRNAMDLSFSDPTIGDEKILFLADLADYLGEVSFFPYGPIQGLKKLRHSLTRYLSCYFRLSLSESAITVSPGRLSVLKNLFLLYRPKRGLLPKELAKAFMQKNSYTGPAPAMAAATSTSADQSIIPEILETPNSTHLVVELMRTLKPQLVVSSLSPQESEHPDAFIRLIEEGKKVGSLVVVDISHSFELSSNPQNSANGVFEYLRRNPLPSHVFILCGLINNRVYADLEISFLLSENLSFLDSWSKMTDLTYCRPPILSQLYYNTLLQDLLKFQIPEVRVPSPSDKSYGRSPTLPEKDYLKNFGELQTQVTQSFHHPALRVESLPITPQTIRLDYGENELAAPLLLKSHLLEGFIRQNISPGEIDPRIELSAFLKKRYGLENHSSESFIYGYGVTPLFSALMELAKQKDAILLIPQGTYGHFVAMAQFFGVPMVVIPTFLDNQFKMTPKDLQNILEQQQGTKEIWLFLNMPVVNPTGALYSPSEVYELLSVANLYKVKIILDAIFSGLEFMGTQGTHEGWNLEQELDSLPAQGGKYGGLEFVLLGGLSKEFAAGGIRFGFAYTRSPLWSQALKETLAQGPGLPPAQSPHFTTLYSVKKIYSHMDQHTPQLLGHLIDQKRHLKNHAQLLCETLSQCGWEPLSPQGGLFMVAKPTQYIGKKIEHHSLTEPLREVVLDAQNLPEILFYKTGLLINNSEWTGIPDYCRFVLSVEESVLQRGLEAIRKFHQEVFP